MILCVINEVCLLNDVSKKLHTEDDGQTMIAQALWPCTVNEPQKAEEAFSFSMDASHSV